MRMRTRIAAIAAALALLAVLVLLARSSFLSLVERYGGEGSELSLSLPLPLILPFAAALLLAVGFTALMLTRSFSKIAKKERESAAEEDEEDEL